MRILSVGGGSGGHVTPVVAVVKKLHQINPESDLRVWCDRRYYKQTHDMISNIARVDVIASGKLRRYANLTIMQHIKYHLFRTHLRNFFDLFKFTYGILQSIFKLINYFTINFVFYFFKISYHLSNIIFWINSKLR